jgi:hypothetical protein
MLKKKGHIISINVENTLAKKYTNSWFKKILLGIEENILNLERVTFLFFETGSCYVVQAGL